MLDEKIREARLKQQTGLLDERRELAEETFLNTFDFAQKVVRAREPQELAQLESEFVGRQTQAVVDQAKVLGQAMMQQANEMAKTTNQEEVTVLSRRRAEAA